jgi:hypothetical protein
LILKDKFTQFIDNTKPDDTFKAIIKKYHFKDKTIAIRNHHLILTTIESNIEPLISKTADYTNFSKEHIINLLYNERNKSISVSEEEMLKTISSFYKDNNIFKNENNFYLYSTKKHLLNKSDQGISLTIQRLMAFLKTDGWVGTQEIAVLFEFFNRRQLFLRSRYNTKKVIYFLQPDFWQLICKEDTVNKKQRKFAYHKKHFQISFFQYCHKVFWPINIHECHWTLMMMDFDTKECIYYDSLLRSNNYCNEKLFPFFKLFLEAHAIHHGYADFKNDEWTYKVEENCPQQNDSCNCGVACILNADFLSDGLELNYLKTNTFTYYRKRYTIQILKGMLDYELISPWHQPLNIEKSHTNLNANKSNLIFVQMFHGWKIAVSHLYHNLVYEMEDLINFINNNLQLIDSSVIDIVQPSSEELHTKIEFNAKSENTTDHDDSNKIITSISSAEEEGKELKGSSLVQEEEGFISSKIIPSVSGYVIFQRITEYKNNVFGTDILIPRNIAGNFRNFLNKAKNEKGFPKENLVRYLKTHEIKMQCYFYLNDQSKVHDLIRPDGLCAYRAYYIAHQLDYNRTNSVNNLNIFQSKDPDFMINDKANVKPSFDKFLINLHHAANRRLGAMATDNESYEFASIAVKMLKNTKDKFHQLLDNKNYWSKEYQGRFDIPKEEFGSEFELMFGLEIEYSQNIFWWINTIIKDAFKNNATYPNTTNSIWVAYEKPVFRDLTENDEYYNYLNVDEVINMMTSTGFHYLMNTESSHVVFVPFPLFDRHEVLEYIFKMLAPEN